MVQTPRPGRAVRGSLTGRPIMAALDLLGRRWALRVLWELRAGPLGARALRDRCDAMSSSVLYQRLRELEAAGLVGRDGDRYELTALGRSLGTAIEPLDAWARDWARSSSAEAPMPRADEA
ncbi:MAG TPA: helix-turn-helix domain-containing protein [Acidimicrobiales bacterium]|nr:helix-turn-helix domain-containing protein [Acidimicrobiales bacterium]